MLKKSTRRLTAILAAGCMLTSPLGSLSLAPPLTAAADSLMTDVYDEVGIDPFSYEPIDTHTARITDYSGFAEHVVIPSEIDGYTITEISSCRVPFGVTCVTVPGTVKKIDDEAFKNCSSLYRVELNEGLEEIGASAFADCYNLWEINIPSTVKEIGAMAFSRCFAPKRIWDADAQEMVTYGKEITLTLPEGVHIGAGAFQSCSGLRLEFPEHFTCDNYPQSGLSRSYDGCFNGTKNYSESVKMAYYLEDGQFVDVYQYNDFTYNINDYTIIGYYDDEWNVLTEYEDIKILAVVTYSLINGHLLYYNVEYNTDDNTLHIPEGTEYIDCQVNYSGWGSDEITTKVILPETVKEIGDNAFKDFSALKSINIPEGVTRIGDSAFSGCGSLAAVELPDALTEIGENAFAYTALTSIEIPENVEEIGREAFARCESLANVTFKGNKLRNIYYGTFEDCPIEELVLPDGLEMIEHNNFYEIPKSITFPDSILNTNQYVFNTTEWYKAIPDDEPVCAGRCFLGFKTEHTFDTFTLPEGTKAIGSMSNVKADHVIIPDGVEYIAEEAFAYTNYKTVTFPDSVRYIGDGCFKKDRDNDRLEKVVFPKEVDYFGSDMFSYTTGSTLQLVDYSKPDHQLTVVLPQNLTEIPDNTFLNRTALFDITIPSSVKRIGKGAFSGCAWLESVVIPEGVEIIDGGESWSSLPGNIVIDYDWDGNVSLVLQNWLTEGAFGNCSSLTSVKLPNSLKILGSSTFCNSAIKSIDLKNVNYIGSQCFSL